MSDPVILNQATIDKLLDDECWVIVTHSAITLIGVCTKAVYRDGEEVRGSSDLSLVGGMMLRLCPYFLLVEQMGVEHGADGKPRLKRATMLFPYGQTTDILKSAVEVLPDSLRVLAADFSTEDRKAYRKILDETFEAQVTERAKGAGIIQPGR